MPAANIPNRVVNLVASAARTSSGNTGNLKDGASDLPLCETMAIYVIITAANLVANGFTFYLETSIDGGTTWVTVCAFTNITAGTFAAGSTQIVRRLDFHGGVFVGEATIEQSASYTFATTTSGQATKGNTPLTRDVRACWDLGGGTSVTFSAFAICVPYGQRG